VQPTCRNAHTGGRDERDDNVIAGVRGRYHRLKSELDAMELSLMLMARDASNAILSVYARETGGLGASCACMPHCGRDEHYNRILDLTRGDGPGIKGVTILMKG